MKIKYQIILLLTAMVMLFGGCGKKKYGRDRTLLLSGSGERCKNGRNVG